MASPPTVTHAKLVKILLAQGQMISDLATDAEKLRGVVKQHGELLADLSVAIDGLKQGQAA